MGVLLTLFFSSFVTLALIHTVANMFFLYWKYPWFDIPMHFFGGVVCALGIAILPSLRIHFFERRTTLYAYVLGVVSIGVCWELFEYSAGIYTLETDVVGDLLLDLTMDVIGAAIGYGIVKSIKQMHA
jgi:hypothetical protein